MDTRAAFAFLLVAFGLGGLFALATGRLSIQNGQITIGAPAAIATTPVAASTTTPVAGVSAASAASDGGTSSSMLSGLPNPTAISQIMGPTTSTTTLGQIYDPTQTLSLINKLAGNGISVNPYGVMA